MNPFTRAIARKLKNRHLEEFIQNWDALEALVIRVYKAGAATPGDEQEHHGKRTWLEVNYPHWREGLLLYWQATRVGGEPASEDPFAYLIARLHAQDFVGDWRAMQTLPAAREALNHFLVDQVQ